MRAACPRRLLMPLRPLAAGAVQLEAAAAELEKSTYTASTKE